jgi:hypothetical protein
MRLTYIHQHFRTPEEAGGGRPYEFARRLAEQDDAIVTMICGGEKNARFRVAGFDVIQVRSSYSNEMSFARRLFSFIKFMLAATKTASSIEADVVFASSTPLTAAVPGIIASRLRRARFVLEIRDLWPTVPIQLNLLPRPLIPIALLLERVAYNSADHVIALSPWMGEGVRAVNQEVPVSIIPNCADTSFIPDQERATVRATLGLAEDDLLLYYAGSLGISYDPEWLARLSLALRGTKARLVVIGEGAGEVSARRLLIAAGEDPARTFIGKIGRDDVFELGSAADLAVSSLIDSDVLSHNSLNKVFDAFALGRPIAFNHGGWLCERALEHGAGWRLPRELDRETVHSWVETLTQDRVRSASDASAAIGREQFDRDTLFDQFQAVLKGESVAS